MENNSLINVVNASVCYGSEVVLSELDFNCVKGQITLLLGANGSGKSTLLRALNGLLPISYGQVFVLNTLVNSRTKKESIKVWRNTGTLLQSNVLFEAKTVIQNIELGTWNRGLSFETVKARINQLADDLNLQDILHAYPQKLSTGQKRRVALARAFVSNPMILLLDEPLASLDGESCSQIIKVMSSYLSLGACIVCATHKCDLYRKLLPQKLYIVDKTLKTELFV